MILRAVIDFHLKPFFSRNFKGAAKKPSTYVVAVVFVAMALYSFYRSILVNPGIKPDARSVAYVFFGYLFYSLLTGRFENRFEESDAMPFFAMPVAAGDAVTLVFLSKLFRQTFQTLVFCVMALPAIYRFCGNWALASGIAVMLFPFVWANEFLMMSLRLFARARSPKSLVLWSVIALEAGSGYLCLGRPLLTVAAEAVSALLAAAAARLLLAHTDEPMLKRGFFALPDSYKKRRGAFAGRLQRLFNPYFYEVTMTETATKKSRYGLAYGIGVEVFIFVMIFVMRREPDQAQNYYRLAGGLFVFGALMLSVIVENRDYTTRASVMKMLGIPFGRFFALEVSSFAVQFILLYVPAFVFVSVFDLQMGLLSIADFVFIPAMSLCFKIRFGENSPVGSLVFTFFAICYGVLKIGTGWIALPVAALGVTVLYLLTRRYYLAVERAL